MGRGRGAARAVREEEGHRKVSPGLVSTGSPESPAGLTRTLQSLIRPQRFNALVRPLLERGRTYSARASALATASYFHPNGFDKLVLDVLAGGQKIVLHAWWPDRDTVVEDSNFHDHRWDFATTVLTGAYRFVEYEEAPESGKDGVLVHKHEYASPDGAQGYELRNVGRRRLVPLRSKTLTAGSVYLLSCDVIHHITFDSSEPTVTLFVQGPPRRACTRVFSRRPLGQSDTVEVQRFSTDEYAERLTSVVEQLGCVALSPRLVQTPPER